MPHPIERFLPPLLLQSGPREVLWWQWLALPVAFAAAWMLGALLARLTTAVAGKLAKRTAPKWDDELVDQLGGPVALAWTMVAAQFLVDFLRLARDAEHFFDRVIHTGLFVA